MQFKPSISFSRLVMALFTLGLFGTAVALFWITYLGSLSIAEHEISRTAKSDAALARLAFTQHYDHLESQIRTIASSPEIRSALETGNSIAASEIAEQATMGLNSAALDILVIDKPTEPGWVNASLGLFDISHQLPIGVRTAMPPDLWISYADPTADELLVTMAISIPVLDKDNGTVLGRVIGGTSISDSHFLPGVLAHALRIEDLGIFFDGQFIAGIGQLATEAIPEKLAGKPNDIHQHLQEDQLYIYSPLMPGRDGHQLSIVIMRHVDTRQNVMETYGNLFTPFLLYTVLLAVGVALLFNRIAGSSLRRLLNYTQNLQHNAAISIPSPGPIKEFNQLASMFQAAFESVRNREEQFRELIDGSMHGVIIHVNHQILYANDALLEMLGHPPGQFGKLVGSATFSVYAPEEHNRLRSYYDFGENGGAPRAFEIKGLRKDGQVIWLEQHVRIIEWRGEQAFYATITNISERKRQEELATKNAYFDILTELPNRRLLIDRLRQTIGRVHKSDESSALMILDLDRFKKVNDTYGPKTGDQVIKSMAARLVNLLGSDQTVARMGGDEFAIILSNREDGWAIENTAKDILRELSRPMDLEDGSQVVLTASLGIALITDGEFDDETLLLQADTSMYQAKSETGSSYRFFSSQVTEQIARASQIEVALRQALENGALHLNYQPIVDYRNGTLKSCEALARWDDEVLGVVPPTEFITVAEESGLIVPLGEWILKEACTFYQSCTQFGFPLDGISVNISPRQCRDSGFVDMLTHILEATGMDPTCLHLEITENVMFEDQHIDPVEILKAISALGVKISLDDFGTGYSSLSYLKRLPIDTLKIDRSFINGLERDHDGQALVKAIVSMADSLGLEIICEGAETREQCDLIVDLGCSLIQGYSIARPMDADHMQSYISRHQPRPQKTASAM